MKRLALCLGFLVTAAAAMAQAGPGSTGINASLLNMFGDIKAFSSKGEVRMSDKNGKEISALPIEMALLDGKLRTDMDMGQIKGGSIPADAAAMIKATGMDKMRVLITPEAKGSYVIYPGLKSYALVTEDQVSQGKVTSSDVGKETVDGHPCVKRKLTITEADGKTQEAFVWVASDLKDFPVKMEMQQRNNTIQISYKAPTLEKPDAKMFELPADYTKYDSLQGLMQAAMLKMFRNN